MENETGEVELSSLVTLFHVNERTQEMAVEYFPWRLTLKQGTLSLRGKKGQLVFEKPLGEVEEAWWKPSRVLNLRVDGEGHSLCFVSPLLLRTAYHSGCGTLNLFFLIRGMKRAKACEDETRAEIVKWRVVFPEK